MNPRRQTVALAPYFRKNNEVFIFMQMRDEKARYNPHTFGFFGGGVEEGETLLEALRREIQEELQVEIGEPTFFKHYDGTIADLDLFLLEVDETFPEKVIVSEGEYGELVPLSMWRDFPIAEFNQRAIKDLIGYLGISEST